MARTTLVRRSDSLWDFQNMTHSLETDKNEQYLKYTRMILQSIGETSVINQENITNN